MRNRYPHRERSRLGLDEKVVEAVNNVNVLSPRDLFGLAAGTDRIIQIECKVPREQPTPSTVLTWLSNDVFGQKYTFHDQLRSTS